MAKLQSNVKSVTINENFPLAGQDNDTQEFRDNFNIIKTSLEDARLEITDLQRKVLLKSELTGFTQDDRDDYNRLSNTKVVGGIYQAPKTQKHNGGLANQVNTTIDFLNGEYQIYGFTASVTVDFLNFPTDNLGKVTLELYGDGQNRTLTFLASGGTVFKKPANFPNPFVLNSATNPLILEVWRHNTGVIYLNLLGQFS